MNNDEYSLQNIVEFLNRKGVFLPPEIVADSAVMLKVKYELMRHDVKSDMNNYLSNYFEDRLIDFKNKNLLIIPKVIIVLSNQCSLSCRYCSMLMPYFDAPWEIRLEDAVSNIKVFLDSVDEVLNFNIIGGEPFLYKNLPSVLEYADASDKIKHIAVFTNGTILPRKDVLEILKRKKVEVVLSDYGDIVQMAKFISLMEENSVNITVRTNMMWINFGDTKNRGRNEANIRKIFSDCIFSRNCKALVEDRLYVCERAARLHMLDQDYSSSQDYIILEKNNRTRENRNRIRSVYNAERADACNFCDAGCLDAETLTAGEQIHAQKERSKYTFILRENSLF